MEFECPKCEDSIEVDPELCDGQESGFVAACDDCEIEIVYDIYYEPQIDYCSVKEMPKCRFKIDRHEWSEYKEHMHYKERKCIHCGITDREWPKD